MQSNQPLFSKSYSKKLYCSQHGNKYIYKCQYKYCSHPHVCHSHQCIIQHFHHQNNDKLVLLKFDSTSYLNKLTELDKMYATQNFGLQANNLSIFIDELKSSMSSIHKVYKQLYVKRDSLFLESQKQLTEISIQKMDEAINIGHNLREMIDNVKGKLNYEGFKQNGNHLTRNNIENYNEINVINQEILIQPQENELQIIETPKSSKQKLFEQNNNQVTGSITKSQGKFFDELFQKNEPVKVLFQPTSINRNLQLRNKQQKTIPFDGSKQSQLFNNNVQTSVMQQKSFFLRNQLTLFFLKSISSKFSWSKTNIVYSWQSSIKSIEKFHEMLQGKNNLLFLFICEGKILGSFYPGEYPKLKDKIKFDLESFLFISDKNEILKFSADPNVQFHLSLTDKLYICHGNTPSYADGIRTSDKTLNNLQYCLPSESYKSQKYIEEPITGSVRIKEFYILEIQGN